MANRMADAMRTYPWLRREVYLCDRFACGRVDLGVLNPEPQPLVGDPQGIPLWFDGEIFSESEEYGGTPSYADAHQLLADPSQLVSVDGVFATCSYDPSKHELRLANDRFGYRVLYVTETPEFFAYAENVSALLAILDTTPHLDRVGFEQFFCFDHMFGERTWWQGIQVLPPASHWIVSDESIAKQQYWSFADIKADPQDPDEVAEEFARLWTRSVRQRRRPGTMPLLLSGGLDSRFLLAELGEQQADLVAFTIGDTESSDVELARRCSELAGIPHHALVITPENWWHRRDEFIAGTDGLVDCIHGHMAAAFSSLRSGNQYSPMNFLGDILFGGSFLQNAFLDDWPNSIDVLIRAWFRPNSAFDDDEVIETTVADARPYAVGPSPDAFVLWQRGARFTIHGQRAAKPFCEFGFPSISEPLIRLVLGAVPDKRRRRSQFYNRVLVNRFPEFFANVPWQKTGRGLAESSQVRLMRSLGKFVHDRKPLKSARGTVASYDKLVARAGIREALDRHDLISDAATGGVARRILRDASQTEGSWRTITRLYTMETYLRQAVGEPALARGCAGEPHAVAVAT